jgi:Lhr-like helicase
MNCPDCKLEGMAALYQVRETALFIASPILEVGVDVADIEEVIMYPEPSNASSCVQRVGRPARGPNTPDARAIVYVKNQVLMQRWNMWPWTPLTHGC